MQNQMPIEALLQCVAPAALDPAPPGATEGPGVIGLLLTTGVVLRAARRLVVLTCRPFQLLHGPKTERKSTWKASKSDVKGLQKGLKARRRVPQRLRSSLRCGPPWPSASRPR